MKDTEQRVKLIVSETLAIENVSNDKSFSDLGADSLEIYELLSAIEAEFGIEISDGDVGGIRTTREIVDYLLVRGVGGRE
ncbi:acyl carrier protein [Paraburkholderia kururiensis]|jgi:acyl carrier protein|uniref:acyl carrier protein n=1 Tax=Paraburkholderia kururiensis TaxID=984307 RepID=UPI0018F58EBD|nr:acyl carrier protein [Paraburkholderia kururiensis]